LTSFLIDTNVLLRFADDRSPEHGIAATAVEHLLSAGNTLCICPQVLVEFWAVATRPESANGLGWPPETAADVIRGLRRQFPLLSETPGGLDVWFELVERCEVVGKRVHDARLAALMLVHGITQLLSFNTSDFPRAWGVDATHPAHFVAPGTY
jgi:predicted nucleic acid-binding protein